MKFERGYLKDFQSCNSSKFTEPSGFKVHLNGGGTHGIRASFAPHPINKFWPHETVGVGDAKVSGPEGAMDAGTF